ncbi:hypothetical protein BJY04DRAFT_60063 [Aspergillus karnatakaensis]|uniref:uncharacterized protein n=1 Tax=Aspergillus karnatakaensis TaxID=1810916 RepID=UPI003CCC9881
MAAIEQSPASQQRIARSRSTRLADHAATAALYVTHPERSLSLRQPTAEPDPATLRISGSRPGLSSASAAAALIAHARKQELGAEQAAAASHAADRRNNASQNYEGYPYQAAMRAIKEGKGPGTNGNRRRAESAPSEPARTRARARIQGPGDPFGDLDKYEDASRIKYAHLNPKLFTATPPVAPELEEHRRKSILEAASMSMAKDMYEAMARKEREAASRQGLPARSRTQRAGSATLQQASSDVLRQALNLQDVAQKRAAEKLANLEDKSAGYRNYYGVETQAARSSFSIRRRRGSNETEQFDAERSKEIRTQMSTLRSKLNAVDQKRDKDRADLLELARKNVDATMQDMDSRLYSGSGQSLVMQRYLEERARERVQKGIQEIDAQRELADKVAIGGRRYVEMTDVEDLARSRLQPTFDEIDDLAQAQRARELEARLDEEQRQRLLAIEREREAEIRMETDRHNQLSMQDLRSKEEKVWPWKRKSRHLQGPEQGPEKDTTQPSTEDRVNGTIAAVPESTQNQSQEGHITQGENLSRQESKFKSWFSKLGRRSSASPSKETNGTHEDQTADETTDQERPVTAQQGTEDTDQPQELETNRAEVSGGSSHRVEDLDAEYTQRSRPVSGVAYAPEGDSRAVPLRSNPVTADDLNKRASNAGVSQLDGITPSEYVALEQDSKAVVEHSKQQRQQEGAHELPTSPSFEKDAPRERVGDHRAALAGIGDVVSKRMSNSTTAGRESRFSEDL